MFYNKNHGHQKLEKKEFKTRALTWMIGARARATHIEKISWPHTHLMTHTHTHTHSHTSWFLYHAHTHTFLGLFLYRYAHTHTHTLIMVLWYFSNVISPHLNTHTSGQQATRIHRHTHYLTLSHTLFHPPTLSVCYLSLSLYTIFLSLSHTHTSTQQVTFAWLISETAAKRWNIDERNTHLS